MSFTWTADHKMTPAEAVTHLRRSLVGIDWQAVQVLAGEVERVRADLLAEKREHLRTVDDALKVRDAWTAHENAVLALAGELDQAQYPAGVSWLHAFAARLRETLGEKTAGPG